MRSRVARSVAHVLIERARSGGDTPRGMLLLETIDGLPAQLHPLLSHFIDAGFAAGAMGLRASLVDAADMSTPHSRAIGCGPPDAMPEGDTLFRAARTYTRSRDAAFCTSSLCIRH